MLQLSTLCATLCSMGVLITVLFRIHILVGFCSLAPALSILIFGRLASKQSFKRSMEQVPYERRQDYANRAVYLQKYAKELRLTNVFRVLTRTYDEAAEGKVGVANAYWKKHFVLMTLRNTFAFPVMYEGMWLLGAFLVMVRQSITMANFVVISSAVNGVTWIVIGFSESLTKNYENALYIQNLKTFLEYKEKIPENQPGLPVPEKPERLELRDVSFRYPGREDYALSYIAITLHSAAIRFQLFLYETTIAHKPLCFAF